MTTPTENLSRFDNLTAEALLGIPQNEPEWLFTGNADDLKTEYRYLARKWHPDNRDTGSGEVFQHLAELHDRAEKKIAAGTWHIPGELIFHPFKGGAKLLKYKKKFGFELGEGYVSSGFVTYVVRPEHKGLYENALKVIKSFDFPNDKIREECTRYLPKIKSAFEAKEGCVLVLEKTPEVVRLRDFLDYEKGKVDPKQVAWILSSLHNLSCYLSWANLTHNDISPDTYFISLPYHSGVLMGGWWYAAPKDAKLRALPDRTYDHAPPDVLRDGKADTRVDLGLIRLVGRELLGDPAGTSIHLNKTIPKSLSAWLRMPTSGNAKGDYKTWMDTVLPESFGARRFVESKVSFSDIYDNKGEEPWVSAAKSSGGPTAAATPAPPPPPPPAPPPPKPARKRKRRAAAPAP